MLDSDYMTHLPPFPLGHGFKVITKDYQLEFIKREATKRMMDHLIQHDAIEIREKECSPWDSDIPYYPGLKIIDMRLIAQKKR
jgi:hypothetical protein